MAAASASKIQSVPVSSSQSVVHLSNGISQQQLADTYALPLSNQPQLQQHFLQQSAYGGIPLTAYNPTYLVQQSNQLLNQHKQHLFKPAASFVSAYNSQSTADSPVPEAQALFQSPSSVASSGQIFSAHQDHLNDVRNDYSYQTLQGSSSNANVPTFERLVAPDGPKANAITQGIQQQPILSEQEVANLLNFGTLNGHQGFIASAYYNTESPGNSAPISNNQFDQPTKQQIINEYTLRQANEEMQQKQTTPPTSYQFVTTGSTQTERPLDGSVLDEHQKRLSDHFGDKNPLRIYVPDDDFNSNVLLKNCICFSFFFCQIDLLF